MDDTTKLELRTLVKSLNDTAKQYRSDTMEGWSVNAVTVAAMHDRHAAHISDILRGAEQRHEIKDDAAPMAIATAAREFLDCFHGETVVRPLSYDDARKNLDAALEVYGR